jgi:hypothetical protein
MKKQFLKITVLLLCFALTLSPIKSHAESDARVQGKCMTNSAVQLKGDMRKLWGDHVIYTSKYMTSALSGLQDKDKVLARLLQNQKDIGNAIKPYYGAAAGDTLAQLLTEHIVIAGKIVDAAKNNDMANVNKYNTEWFKNADQIAAFLSKANPNWSQNALKDMLYAHLKFVTEELITRIKMDWDGNIRAFDNGFSHMMHFADMLSGGIVKQFPNKFNN